MPSTAISPGNTDVPVGSFGKSLERRCVFHPCVRLSRAKYVAILSWEDTLDRLEKHSQRTRRATVEN
jgi:hypothetical protein